MKTCNIALLKTHLSSYLTEVKRGEEIIVTEHNKPIAKITSIHEIPPLPKANLAELEKSPIFTLKRGSLSNAELVRKLRDEN